MSAQLSNASWKDGQGGRTRKCTDILFLILIILSWVSMTAIGFAVTGVIDSKHLSKGNPERLVNGMDYYGNICGVTNFTTSTGNNVIDLPKAYLLPSGSAICVDSCPIQDDFNTFYCKYETKTFIEEQVERVNLTNGIEAANTTQQSLYLYYTATKQCMPQLKTRLYLGYCQPDILVKSISNEIDKDYGSTIITDSSNFTLGKSANGEDGFFDDTMADAYLTRHVIFGFGLGGAMILGFIFLLLIRAPGILTTIVWTIIFAILVALIAGGHYMRETSYRWDSEGVKEEHEIKGMYWLSIISYTCAILWFLTICCVRKRIYLAISCVKEASNAMATMPIIVIYPIFQVLGFFAFLVPWGIFMAYLASSGEVEAECMCPNSDNTTFGAIPVLNNSSSEWNTTFNNQHLLECDDGCYLYKSFTYSKNTKYAGLFMVFSFFWTSQFIVAIGQLVVAMAITMWYFTRDKHNVGNQTFLRAIVLTTYYHLGTCAFGSLIIAIIKSIRTVIAYIERKAAKMQNQVAQVALKALQCCLWLLERCMKFVNKNAYIQTAIHGYSFCKAAKEAFFLILRNVLRISAVSIVSDFVLIVGKLFIVVASTIGAYLYLDHYYSDYLNGLYMPTVFVFLASFATAEIFNEVFGMAIMTILQCFLTDEEIYPPEDRFAPGSLAKTIESTQQSSLVSKLVYPSKLRQKREE